MTPSRSSSMQALHTVIAQQHTHHRADIAGSGRISAVTAAIARQHSHVSALDAGRCVGAASAALARQQRAHNALRKFLDSQGDHIRATFTGSATPRLASTALAAAAIARQHSHVSAPHESINRQGAITSTALATGSVGRALVAGYTAHIRTALDAIGSVGAVTAAIAQQYPHVSALHKLINRQGAITGAALAGRGVRTVIVQQQRAHVSVLQNLVANHRASINATLETGGSLRAVTAAIARQHSHVRTLHELLDSQGIHLRTAHAGRGASAVIRPFVSREPIPIATHDGDIGLVDEIDAFLEQTLAKLNPAFPSQLRGSMQRNQERGPDWWTQAAASQRKLFLGVLHTAAPDHLVMTWVTNPKQLDRRNRPTRRAKIAWLCRSIPNESYRKFLIAELDSALELIELFNTAVHVDEFPEFEETFSWTQLRLKVAVRHILEIWLKWS